MLLFIKEVIKYENCEQSRSIVWQILYQFEDKDAGIYIFTVNSCNENNQGLDSIKSKHSVNTVIVLQNLYIPFSNQ